jgi:hypothetical protein
VTARSGVSFDSQAQTHLHVNRTADDVADKKVRDAHLPAGETAEHRTEVKPVESDPGKLKAPEGVVPGLGSKQVRVRIGI